MCPLPTLPNMTLNPHPIYPSAGRYVLRLHRDAQPQAGMLAGRIEHVSSGDSADFASGQGDATIFALLGSAGVAQDFSPTGAVAGASDPHYTGIVVLETYSIIAAVGAALKYTTQFQGASALTRAVA